jgi:phosphoglycerate dehydrogenase-like enzyme
MHIAVWANTDPRLTADYIGEGCELLRAQAQVDLVVQEGDEEQEAMAQIAALLPDVDALVISPWFRPTIDDAYWQAAPRLKIFAGTFDHRFDRINFELLANRGIAVIDTSRSMTPSVAEFALAMTMNLIRDIPATMAVVHRGEWKSGAWDNPGYVFGDLTGQRIGLAGFCSINRRYAELIAPFRCAVKSYDPFVSSEELARYGVEPAESMVELARHAEVFVIGIPPTPRTLEIINRDVIEALPKGSLLVLVTRMAVVEQEPLWRRLQAGEIRAAIDVFAPEPPPADAWFRNSPYVLATPHIAGGVVYCHRRCFTEACRDTLAVLGGETPRYQARLWDHRLYQGQEIERRAGDMTR